MTTCCEVRKESAGHVKNFRSSKGAPLLLTTAVTYRWPMRKHIQQQTRANRPIIN